MVHLIRFGAGLKGKVLDAWLHGMPVATTPIGAEGLERPGVTSGAKGDESSPSDLWGGLICPLTGGCSSSGEAAEVFAEAAVRLHEDEGLWCATRDEGRALLGDLFEAEDRWEIEVLWL